MQSPEFLGGGEGQGGSWQSRCRARHWSSRGCRSATRPRLTFVDAEEETAGQARGAINTRLCFEMRGVALTHKKGYLHCRCVVGALGEQRRSSRRPRWLDAWQRDHSRARQALGASGGPVTLTWSAGPPWPFPGAEGAPSAMLRALWGVWPRQLSAPRPLGEFSTRHPRGRYTMPWARSTRSSHTRHRNTEVAPRLVVSREPAIVRGASLPRRV